MKVAKKASPNPLDNYSPVPITVFQITAIFIAKKENKRRWIGYFRDIVNNNDLILCGTRM